MVVNLHNWRYRHGVRGQGIGTQKKRVAKTSRQDYNETCFCVLVQFPLGHGRPPFFVDELMILMMKSET
jgi:hypothetical protein